LVKIRLKLNCIDLTVKLVAEDRGGRFEEIDGDNKLIVDSKVCDMLGDAVVNIAHGDEARDDVRTVAGVEGWIEGRIDGWTADLVGDKGDDVADAK